MGNHSCIFNEVSVCEVDKSSTSWTLSRTPRPHIQHSSHPLFNRGNLALTPPSNQARTQPSNRARTPPSNRARTPPRNQRSRPRPDSQEFTHLSRNNLAYVLQSTAGHCAAQRRGACPDMTRVHLGIEPGSPRFIVERSTTMPLDATWPYAQQPPGTFVSQGPGQPPVPPGTAMYGGFASNVYLD
ncbi:hypothetical protein Bbelb_012520 [Branchiostoma belcheri]|nr:hypothetical protein Bbelb_012520 [Branchiostoma belcheri]